MSYNKNEVYELTFQRQWQLFHSEGSERRAENFFLFRCELSLVPAVNGPGRPVRTLSSVEATQKSQPSVDHRSSLTPSSDTSHLRLVSLATPGLPQGASPQPAQHPGFVSLKHQESFFPHQTTTFFSTPLELSAANSSARGHDSVPRGEELWSPPTYPPASAKPPPTRTSTPFTSVYFLICSVNITECLRGKRCSFPTKVTNICLD